MKFRIRSKEGDLLSPENVFLAQIRIVEKFHSNNVD